MIDYLEELLQDPEEIQFVPQYQKEIPARPNPAKFLHRQLRRRGAKAQDPQAKNTPGGVTPPEPAPETWNPRPASAGRAERLPVDQLDRALGIHAAVDRADQRVSPPEMAAAEYLADTYGVSAVPGSETAVLSQRKTVAAAIWAREAAAGTQLRLDQLNQKTGAASRSAEIFYRKVRQTRAAAGYVRRETPVVPVPIPAEPTLGAGLEPAWLDRFFQRDARRYSGAFELF